MSIDVVHYTDPGCPWAYSAEPFIRALEWRYGDGLTWRTCLIGLAEDPRFTTFAQRMANRPALEAAMRECLEETGYRALNAEALGAVNPNPALFANRLYGYFALGVTREGVVKNTGSEVTEPVLVPLRDLRDKLVAGEIDHALVAQTLWRYLYLYGPR